MIECNPIFTLYSQFSRFYTSGFNRFYIGLKKNFLVIFFICQIKLNLFLGKRYLFDTKFTNVFFIKNYKYDF